MVSFLSAKVNHATAVLKRILDDHGEYVSSWESISSLARCRRMIKALWQVKKLALVIGWRAMMSMSQPGSMFGMSERSASRIQRLARLRCTAFPTERPAMIATREASL